MKVGDRVRVISVEEYDIQYYRVNAEGVVVKVVTAGGGVLDVEFDTGTFMKQRGETATWSVMSDQVEVVN